MIRFEGLYLCRNLRADALGITLVECFSRSADRNRQFVLFAKLVGLRRGVFASFVASITHLDATGGELVWQDSFKVLPPLERVGPVEVAALCVPDQEFAAGSYFATLTLASGEQDSANFEIV